MAENLRWFGECADSTYVGMLEGSTHSVAFDRERVEASTAGPPLGATPMDADSRSSVSSSEHSSGFHESSSTSGNCVNGGTSSDGFPSVSECLLCYHPNGRTQVCGCSDVTGTNQTSKDRYANFPLPPGTTGPSLLPYVLRHQSLPLENSQRALRLQENTRLRRQSSPGCTRSSDCSQFLSSIVNTSATGSAGNHQKVPLRPKLRCVPNNNNNNNNTNHHVYERALLTPTGIHSSQYLEPIPQGQELSVHAHSTNIGYSLAQQRPSGFVSNMAAVPRGNDTTRSGRILNPTNEEQKYVPCSNQPVSTISDRQTIDRGDVRNSGHADPIELFYGSSVSTCDKRSPPAHLSNTQTPSFDCKNSHCQTHSVSAVDHTDSNRSPLAVGSHWARDLLGRLYSSGTTSIDQEEMASPIPLHGAAATTTRHPCAQTAGGGVVVDPKRLPKVHGPASARLQFSKKPLQQQSYPYRASDTMTLFSSSVGSSPASHLLPNRGLFAAASSVLKSSSWKPRKNPGRVRWFSHSISCDSGTSVGGPEVSGFSSSSQTSRLSCSVVEEEIREAVDLLVDRCQSVSLNSMTPLRVGFRVKRAAESEHLLVIRKSSSNSNEDVNHDYSFGHFDETHPYGTLFRHSTCYDVLPDSGKLIMLDSRLVVVRAIRALLENGVQAAPIWHSQTQTVTGLFSQALAIHLLAYACSADRSHPPSDNETTSPIESESEKLSDPKVSSVSHQKIASKRLANGLRRWGSRRLSEVLRLFHRDCEQNGGCACGCGYTGVWDRLVIVSPRLGLRRALYWLLNQPHRRHERYSALRSSHLPHQSQCEKRGSCCSCCFKNNRCGQSTNHFDPIDSEQALNDNCFFFEMNGRGNDNIRSQLSTTEGCTMVPNCSRVRQRHLSDPCTTPLTCTSHKPTTNNAFPMSEPQRSVNSTDASVCPSHLVVMDPSAGNVIGLVCANRLLAYLRLRLDQLPYSLEMLSPVGNLKSIRWKERSLLANTYRNIPTQKSNHHGSVLNSMVSPVLSPSASCYNALIALASWSPQLPCLPVVKSNIGAGLQSVNPVVSFITRGDVLNFVLGDSPNVAIHQPISKILESKLNLCRSEPDCGCFAHETVAVVLDRMFRLKAPCLILFDSPNRGYNDPTHPSGQQSPISFGPPVGAVTAVDLLQAIVLSRSRSSSGQKQHQHHPELRANSVNSEWLMDDSNNRVSGNSSISSNNWTRISSLVESNHYFPGIEDDGLCLSQMEGFESAGLRSTAIRIGGSGESYHETQPSPMLKNTGKVGSCRRSGRDSSTDSSSSSSSQTYSRCCSDHDLKCDCSCHPESDIPMDSVALADGQQLPFTNVAPGVLHEHLPADMMQQSTQSSTRSLKCDPLLKLSDPLGVSLFTKPTSKVLPPPGHHPQPYLRGSPLERGEMGSADGDVLMHEYHAKTNSKSTRRDEDDSVFRMD